jgi:effector-binding domain-containing protein
MSYQVEVKQLAGQPLAVVRRVASQEQLSRVVPAACGEVWNFVRAAGIAGAGRHVAVYLDGAIHIEVGVEVPGPFTSDGNVVYSETPAGTVATTVHMGPYDRLGDAHDAILNWCAAQQRLIAGPNWEIYGHWDDDPAKLRTDVFYLLRDDDAP